MPGLRREFSAGLPDQLVPYWSWDFWSFHSAEWWRTQWEQPGTVEVMLADAIPEGWQLWLKSQEICLAQGYPANREEAAMLRLDAGRNLGFTRMVARKKEGG